jgi:hypothetical protein
MNFGRNSSDESGRLRLGAERTTPKLVGRAWNPSEREMVRPTARRRNILLHNEIGNMRLLVNLHIRFPRIHRAGCSTGVRFDGPLKSLLHIKNALTGTSDSLRVGCETTR